MASVEPYSTYPTYSTLFMLTPSCIFIVYGRKNWDSVQELK